MDPPVVADVSRPTLRDLRRARVRREDRRQLGAVIASPLTLVEAGSPGLVGAVCPPRVWERTPMDWGWVAPAGTVVVALAGIGATLWTAAQGREHAERLAHLSHRREREEMRRKERLEVYADALAHAVELERRLDAVWTSDGSYKLSPKPAGAPLALAPMDGVSVRMHLLADGEAERAWSAFVSALNDWQWRGEVEYSGDPSESPPDHVLLPLRSAITGLKDVCRRSLQRSDLT